MVYVPSRPVDKEAVLDAIRAAVEAAGGRLPSLRTFLANSNIKYHDIFKHFPKWLDAISAAGFSSCPANTSLDDADLLADWAGTVRKLGRIPKQKEHLLHGRHHGGTIAKRLGCWHNLPDLFRKFAEGKDEWADVLALLPPPGYGLVASARSGGRKPGGKRAFTREGARLGDRRIYGAPLDFGNLRHAPTNEMGVVLLFGAMASELGFLVESIQPAFPDCEAKRRIGQDAWQFVRIEFEYESRNFREHEHPPGECDIIVCWVHNWIDCPKTLEVIALKDEIDRMRRKSTLPMANEIP